MIKIKNNGLPALHLVPSTEKIMWSVIISLMPLLFFSSLNSPRRLSITLIAIIFALILEALILILRKTNPFKVLKDGSAVLTAILLALCLPITAPIWLIFWGIFFAIVIGKGIYGGLGNNLFNPAMLAFVALLISFPKEMNYYTNDYLAFFTILDNSLDATSSATILDNIRQHRILELSIENPNLTVRQIIMLIIYLLTAIFLIKKKYIDSKITIFVLLSAFLTALIFWLVNPEKYLNPFWQVLSGALIFGSIFIATDPITSSITNLGKLLYAINIGVLTICIRNLGNYPDGFAFAVLISNSLNPLFDLLRTNYE